MKTITTNNGTKIEFFSTSKEISAKRWNAFNTECIKCSALGTTFEDAAAKVDAMNSHLRYQNNEAYRNENENLKLQLYGIYNGINIKAGAVVYLVKSIDGELLDPFEADIQDAVQKIEDSEISEYDIENVIWDIRKK